MAKPTDLSPHLRWATVPLIPADVTEPDTTHKDQGWQDAEEPPHSYFNYWMKLVYLWIVYLDNLTAEALTWTAVETFTKGIVVTNTTGANAVAVTGTGNGNQTGGFFTGGASSGIGVQGVGGAANGMGAVFIGTGTGTGAFIQGGGGAAYGAEIRSLGTQPALYAHADGLARGAHFVGHAGSLSAGYDGGYGIGGAGDDDGFGCIGGAGLRGDGGTGSGTSGGPGVKGNGGTGAAGTGGGYGLWGQGGTPGAGGSGGGGVLGVGISLGGAAIVGGEGVVGQGGYSGVGAFGGVGGLFTGGSDLAGGNVGDGVRAAAGSGVTGNPWAFHGTHGGLLLDDGHIVADNNIVQHILGFTQIDGTLDVVGAGSFGSTLAVTGNTAMTTATVSGTLSVSGVASFPGGISLPASTAFSTMGAGMLNSWVDGSGIAGSVPGAWKDAYGIKHLSGTIKSGADGTKAVILSAPFRPTADRAFTVFNSGATDPKAQNYVTINTSGDVFIHWTGGGTSFIYLDGINFL